jgi:hypothetical protein
VHDDTSPAFSYTPGGRRPWGSASPGWTSSASHLAPTGSEDLTKPVAHLDHATLLQSAVHAVAVPPSVRCEVLGYETSTSDGGAGC